MTRSAAHISVAAFGLAALVLIAGRANAQSATSNSTIQWNDPPGQAPSTGTVSPVPGSATPSASPPGATKLPPGTVVPAPDSVEAGAPPPGATKLPPGTVVPPPDSADSGTIRWNTPQPSASTMVPATPGGPAVSWRSGFQGGVIWVEVIDPASFYRVERIELVAPDGRAFASREITRTQARYDYTAGGGNVGVGAWGGSHHSGVGVGVGFPLNGRGVERADTATHSVARFQLADPRTYRRTAANWSVLVRMVDRNGGPSTARFPAPIPARR